MSKASPDNIQNISCQEFLRLSEGEKRTFVIGVANGRGMTAGLFEAYTGAAQDMAATVAEKEAIATSYQTVGRMMLPLLEIDAASMLNGILAACNRPEFRDRLIIEAIAFVHVEAAKALRTVREQANGND